MRDAEPFCFRIIAKGRSPFHRRPFAPERLFASIADARQKNAHSKSHSRSNNYALETKVRECRFRCVRPFVFAFNERRAIFHSLSAGKNHTGCGKRYTVRADSCIVMINFTSINSLMVVWNKINIACRCWRAAAGCGEIPTARAAHLPWISFSKDNFTVIRESLLAETDKFFNSHHGYKRLAFLIGV